MLRFLQENKERVIIPAFSAIGLLLISKLGVPGEYNYIVPLVSEVILFIILIIIYKYRETHNEKQQKQSHKEEESYLSSKLESLLEKKEKLKSCNEEIIEKLEKRIAETLDKIYEAEDAKYIKIKQTQKELKKIEGFIRSEKESQKQSLYKAVNVLSGEMVKEINDNEKQAKEIDRER